MTTHDGRCHCGAIGFTYTTAVAPAAWSVRACQCTFCRAHAALSTSDPAGSIRFHAQRPASLVRYRFGLRSADFLLCGECGVYIGAAMATGDRLFGIVNVNALAPVPHDVAAACAMTYEGETVEQRARRREERWSPAAWSSDAAIESRAPEDVRRLGRQAVDWIADYLAGLPDGPVFRPVPPEIAERFRSTPAPRAGEDAAVIFDEFRATVAPYPFGNGHPRFWGWVNSPPVPIGIVAEALAAAMNPSCAGGNHAAIWVEHQVLGWFKEMLGFPTESHGLLVSGGSMASLTALAVARHVKAGYDVRRQGLQGGTPKLVLYLSEEGHGCLRKAAELMGLGSENVRLLPIDDEQRMRVDALESAIAADLAAGHRPIAVAASAGTVSSGAIDPLREIAAVCRRHGVWFHVDGAYGAPAVLARHYRDQLEAIALADSLAVDPHKWLGIPVEAGLVLVRDAAAMRDAFSLVPPYLRTDGSATGVGGPPWFSEFGFQQTRGFRALKVWMALKRYGLDGYRRRIEESIELARYLHRRVGERPALEALAPPGLSIVCFRWRPPEIAGDDARLDAVNRTLLERIQLGGEAFLSGTTLRGAFALRACIVNDATTRADLDLLLDLVEREGRRSL